MIATQADAPRLGYGRFLLQVLSVAAAYLAVSAVLAAVFIGVNGQTLSLEQTSLLAALASPLSALAGLGVIWLWLRRREDWRAVLGLLPIANWRQTLFLALVAVGGTLTIFALGGVAVEAIGLATPQTAQVLGWASASPALFALWIVGVAWLGAGFGEEVLWRGFLMDRLARLPGIGGSMAVVLGAQAAIFGLAHAYQGWGGVLITGAVGLLMGWIRLKNGGAIWAAVLAHALVDTIMLSLGYAARLGW